MLKKIFQYIKSFFSPKFIHPIIDQDLSDSIDDKLSKRKKEQLKKVDENTILLNNLLKTYLAKKYDNSSDMALAYEIANKKWKKHCSLFNSSNKLINLSKKAFEVRVQQVIKKLKENELVSK